ncbi:prolyl oligopeptidase family serine peptidase [Shewanella marisflavi]|uniref:prolyl oligopeptidase family serine peptidase n=1 Tax=Shewanella marisflavi TaxID=260364 RepID=UPI00200D6DFF|nr:prolyl oligopeptidase family serine peptidase [Shewanella marisflavi]MCL1040283.1 prolyl oligopeptidase family serine peptidase [Shewanella marisflavi]
MKYIIALVLLIGSFSTQGVPIPASTLYRSPMMSQVTFTPDGQYISALIVEEGKSYISLIDTRDKEYQHIGSFNSDERLSGYSWIDNETLYISYLWRGEVRSVLLKLSQQEGKFTSELVKLPEDSYLVDPLIDEPGYILFAKNRYKGRPSNQLYKLTIQQLVDKDFDKASLLEHKLKDVVYFGWDDIRRVLFAVTVDIEAMKGEVLYRELTELRWKTLFEITDKKMQFSPVGFIGDEKLAVLSNEHTDKIALYEFDIASQKLGKVIYEHPKYDLVDAQVNIAGNGVSAVTYVENGQHVSQFLDNSTTETDSLIARHFKGKEGVISAYAKDNRHQVLFVYASNDPGSYYLYDRQADRVELLTELNPELMAYELSETKVFSVESAPGVDVEGYLTLPNQKSRNGVLLVMPHGGPIGIRDYNYFNNDTQYFTSRGFTVLRVNFRGSQGYGKSFLNSGKGEFGKAIEQDITAAVNHVSKQHTFEKMCAMGASYGGYSALMLAIKHPDDYQCAIGAYGIYDLPLLFNGSNYKVLEEYRKTVSEVVGELSDDLLQYSPVYLADKIKAPVLLIAGKEDRIADFEHSQRMQYVLEKQNKSVEHLYYDRTAHGQNTWYWQQHENAYVADYLKRTLALKEYHEMSGVKPELAQQLGDDLATIADGYNFKNKVENSPSQALAYYRQAALAGDGRSAYNYGVKLVYKGKQLLKETQGEETKELMGVDDSLEGARLVAEGISWAEKGSALGYASASHWLGKIYDQGEHVTQDLAKAVDFYNAAVEQGYDARALLRMGKVYCLAEDELKDVQRCTELLALSKLADLPKKEQKNAVTEDSRSLLRWVIGQLYAHGHFDAKETLLIQDLVKQEYGVSLAQVALDDVEIGAVEYSRYYKKYRVYDKDKRFSASPSLELGMVFGVEPQKGVDEQRKVAVIAKWIKVDDKGRKEIVQSDLLWGSADEDNWNTRISFKEKELFKGKLTVELSDLNNNLLATRTLDIL